MSVNLGQLRKAIAADMEDADPDIGGPDLGRFVTGCPWEHVLDLVRDLLADKTVETVVQFAAVTDIHTAEVVRQYRAVNAKRVQT